MKPLVAVLALAAASPLMGQSSIRGADEPVWDSKASQRELHEYAECAVKRHPKEASEIILDGSGTAMDKYRAKVFDPACLSPTMMGLKIPPAEARFAIANALVRRNLQNYNPRNVLLAAPLPVSYYIPKYAASTKKLSSKELREREARIQRAEAVLALLAYGECVVRANPTVTHSLLFSKLQSPDESFAFDALMPALSGCLTKGRQFRADRPSLRGALALTYYRLAHAPKSPAVTASKEHG